MGYLLRKSSNGRMVNLRNIYKELYNLLVKGNITMPKDLLQERLEEMEKVNPSLHKQGLKKIISNWRYFSNRCKGEKIEQVSQKTSYYGNSGDMAFHYKKEFENNGYDEDILRKLCGAIDCTQRGEVWEWVKQFYLGGVPEGGIKKVREVYDFSKDKRVKNAENWLSIAKIQSIGCVSPDSIKFALDTAKKCAQESGISIKKEAKKIESLHEACTTIYGPNMKHLKKGLCFLESVFGIKK